MNPHSTNSNQPSTPANTREFGAANGAQSPLAKFASTPARRVVAAVLVMGLSGAITLLFWKKLQLVTGVPRTAYAVPEHTPDPKPEQNNKSNASAQVTEESQSQPN